MKVLSRMHSHSGVSYEAEFHQIKSQLALEREQKLGLLTAFKHKSYRWRLCLCVILVFGQQTTGIVPLQNYQVILYEELGIGGELILVLVGVWGTLTVISTTIGSSLFDKLGRRQAYFIAMSIILVASILLAIFWARFEASGNKSKVLGDLAIFSMFLFLCGDYRCKNYVGTLTHLDRLCVHHECLPGELCLSHKRCTNKFDAG